MEVGDAILILDDDFAIDDSRLTIESRDSLDYPAIGAGPISSMPGEGPDLDALDDDQGAAVMLDLVNQLMPARHESYFEGYPVGEPSTPALTRLRREGIPALFPTPMATRAGQKWPF